MPKPKIDLVILARAIAKLKGTKPQTYMRKMSKTVTLKTPRGTKYTQSYPQFAMHNPRVALIYKRLAGMC
jgi:hypothetical protein